MADLKSVIVGGGIGLAGTMIGFAGSALQSYWKRKDAKASAHAVVLAYVEAVLQIEERRRYSDVRRQRLEALRSGMPVTLPQVADNYLNANEMKKNANEIKNVVIGQLTQLQPDEARDVALFLQLNDGLDADEAAISTGKADQVLKAPDAKISFLEENLKLRGEMVSLGHKLVRRLG